MGPRSVSSSGNTQMDNPRKCEKVLLLTDNAILLSKLSRFILRKKKNHALKKIDLGCSQRIRLNGLGIPHLLKTIDVKKSCQTLIKNYDLIFSVHCKQIFPKKLVRSITCVNIHPGLNPYNRGWYPHVFSILNSLPAGITIHLMDDRIDHGGIIARKKIKVEEFDTSLSLYNKILEEEMRLLDQNFGKIIQGKFKTFSTKTKGNLNTKRDYSALLRLDLNKVGVFRNFLNYLRAMSHGDYNNCYFYDKRGKKIFVTVSFRKNLKAALHGWPSQDT